MAAPALAAAAHAASAPVEVPIDMSGTPSTTAPTPAPTASAKSSGDDEVPGELPALDFICTGQFTDSGRMASYAIRATRYEWQVDVTCNDGSHSFVSPNYQGVAYSTATGGAASPTSKRGSGTTNW